MLNSPATFIYLNIRRSNHLVNVNRLRLDYLLFIIYKINKNMIWIAHVARSISLLLDNYRTHPIARKWAMIKIDFKIYNSKITDNIVFKLKNKKDF